ncbi:hypothetical protein SKAU_G00135310 [Synaphobranchus kaupii]|uniref:Uncharacterized protein n=1 Tax=Synaphobranchus kaupii TaxID=118154 RepID=A0A9Q1J3W5_SYNKA|nr:hypothetical protein SKAU_G00135310 [Synaphobranchus kaupii]
MEGALAGNKLPKGGAVGCKDCNEAGRKSPVHKVALAALRDNMLRDCGKKGQERVINMWGHAAWALVVGEGGPELLGQDTLYGGAADSVRSDSKTLSHDPSDHQDDNYRLEGDLTAELGIMWKTCPPYFAGSR